MKNLKTEFKFELPALTYNGTETPETTKCEIRALDNGFYHLEIGYTSVKISKDILIGLRSFMTAHETTIEAMQVLDDALQVALSTVPAAEVEEVSE